MKRAALFGGIVLLLVLGFIIMGNARHAEGPAQSGGVTSAASHGQPAVAKVAAVAVPITPATVSTRDMRQILEVTGTLKTDDDVQIGSRIAGKVVEVRVKEGDRVGRGAVLVRLDDRELRAQIARARGMLAGAQARLSEARNQGSFKDTAAQAEFQRAQANLAAVKSRVQQALTNARLLDTELRLRIETAQSGVRVATERLSIAREVTRKQELRQAQLAVDQAEAMVSQARVDADNARQNFERRQMLYKQDAIAKEEVDEWERRHKSAQANTRVAEASVNVAKQKLELATEGSRPEEVRIAEGQLAAAERNLTQARSDEGKRQVAADEIAAARSAQQQSEAAVRTARAGLVQDKMSVDVVNNALAVVSQARADIQFYETQLADLTIRAPVAGVVSTRQVNVGENVTPTSPLLHLVALQGIFLEAQVPELEVALLRSNASAEVTVDALPGRKLAGAVREVIPVADRNSKAFRVRIAVLGGAQLPSGGYARARVQVGRRPSTVVVDKSTVLTESGDKYVWLIGKGEDGQTIAKRQLITVGLVDDRYAEILTGLQPGQQVIGAGSPAIIEGTPVTVSAGT